MNKALLVVFFCVLGTAALAQDSLNDQRHTSYMLGNEINTRVSKMHALDTGMRDFFVYHPAYQNGFYAFTGNLGSPAYRLDYQPLQQVGFDKGIYLNYPFFLRSESTRYYRTRSPFTELTYVNAQLKEQYLHVIHTQNIRPRWNAGFEYNRIDAKGYYNRQYLNYLGFAASTWYSNKSGRYKLFSNYIINRVRQQENGGVAGDTLFEKYPAQDPQFVGVNLLRAENKIRQYAFTLTQSYDFGRRDTISVNSKRFLDFEPRHRLTYRIAAERNTFTYKDALPVVAYYTGLYNFKGDTSSVLDSFQVDVLRNQISLSNDLDLDSARQLMSYRLSAFQTLAHYTDKDGASMYPYCNGIILGLSAAKGTHVNPFLEESIARFYNVKTSTFPTDASLRTGIKLTVFKGHEVQITTSFFQNEAGTLFQRGLTSNVNPSVIALYQGVRNITAYGLSYTCAAQALKVDYTHYSFDGTLSGGSFATVGAGVQTMDQVKVVWNQSLFDFLHLDSRLVLQKGNNKTAPTLPVFLAYESLYYIGNWFKVLKIRMGLDAYYATNYTLPLYLPIERSYVIPSTATTSNSAAYPMIDFVAAAKLKRARIFFRIDHLNQGLMPAPGSYSALAYPLPPRTLKIGVEWRFFD